ncbi:MAG: hypothetical protein ACREBU_26310 [Nitrososphaera sp.]
MDNQENNNKHVTIDDLAVMIKKGFDDVDKQVGELKTDMDKQFDGVNDHLEKIELRLDNVAYRFELKELENRVIFLERKVGIAH